MGVPDDQINGYLEKEAKDRGEKDAIEVWHENWDAFRIYRACQWEQTQHLIVAKGMVLGSRMRFVGIASAEIESAARGLQVTYDEDLIVRVRTLVGHAKAILNEGI